MTNRYSDIAREIMLAGLRKETCAVPTQMTEMAKDMFNVPERPPELGGKRFKMALGRTIGVPVTGGLDSTVLYLRATEEIYGRRFREDSQVVDFWMVRPFYVNFGQPYAAKEIAALRTFVKEDTIELINAPIRADEKDYWKHIIPGRNLYILSLIAEQMMGGELWFGAVDGEMPLMGGDKSRYFIGAVNNLFRHLPMPVEVTTPLSKETKTDLVKWWLESGYSKDMLDRTVSCFSAEEGHCAACQACLRKWIAYSNNGLELKTNMDIKIGCAEYIEKYKRVLGEALAKNDFTHYSKHRCEQDLSGIALL